MSEEPLWTAESEVSEIIFFANVLYACLEIVVFSLTDDKLVDSCGGGEVPDELQASTSACIIRYGARGLSAGRGRVDGVQLFTVCSLTPLGLLCLTHWVCNI